MRRGSYSFTSDLREPIASFEQPLRNGDQRNEVQSSAQDAPTSSDAPASTPLDHERAQALILEQANTLLPPAVANALADHLLTCDRCYRFAQDVAHQERQSGKHRALPNP